MTRPVVYTEVDTKVATLRERIEVVRLVWRASGEIDVPASARRKIRRITICAYLKPRARVSTYVVSSRD